MYIQLCFDVRTYITFHTSSTKRSAEMMAKSKRRWAAAGQQHSHCINRVYGSVLISVEQMVVPSGDFS